MNSKLIFGLYVLLAIVQLAVPVGQISRYENILRTGSLYKFRTAPVDPYDAFRGRYVALNYADTVAPLRKGERLEDRSKAYVFLRRDGDGFAQFVELSAEPPAEGDYLRVQYSTEAIGAVSHFQLPFDKFFMEEAQAPQAEAAYRKHVRGRSREDRTTYVSVRVKGGRGVIEDLYIDNRPIREFLKGQADRR
jgi:uncharacterized membrane-anchored protein